MYKIFSTGGPILYRILLEVLFVFILLFAGGSFWVSLKAAKHLRGMLADSAGLGRLIAHFAYGRLLAEAQQVKAPPFGTFGDIISLWDKGHHKSLSSTRNRLLFVVLVVLAASWWLGIWYFAASLILFLALGLEELPAPAKNNNANHLPSVILKLVRWHQENDRACQEFCYRMHPGYQKLYELLNSPELRATSASE